MRSRQQVRQGLPGDGRAAPGAVGEVLRDAGRQLLAVALVRLGHAVTLPRYLPLIARGAQPRGVRPGRPATRGPTRRVSRGRPSGGG